eukprot:CAMPEP_0119386780 /NCGR_PEP_ID=MMETSP1334-20130426/97628_1 /TAXON_ID=127549 /ORGANISM="Calcidiscus leptoporus, Strain RCC1130" /LENGTH=132 /DNA_ID=CAMNT_0007408349 /DNA_START=461 /DNA_END=856 /DNA_ORIENTATION=+
MMAIASSARTVDTDRFAATVLREVQRLPERCLVAQSTLLLKSRHSAFHVDVHGRTIGQALTQPHRAPATGHRTTAGFALQHARAKRPRRTQVRVSLRTWEVVAGEWTVRALQHTHSTLHRRTCQQQSAHNST